MTRLVYSAAAVLVVLALTIGSLVAQEPAKSSPPIRGQAEIQILAPKAVPDHKAGVVNTVIQVKNVSPTGSIAGLKVEQYWWDKANSPAPVAVASQRLKKPLQPGEIVKIELQVPIDPKMYRDTYKFSHANGGPTGGINVKTVKAF